MSPKKIIITGGHVTPALAVIDMILRRHPEVTMVFVGRMYNNNRENTESFEYKEIQKRSLTFRHLVAGRFTRNTSWETIKSIVMIPWGFIHALQILLSEKPDLVLSFGGYLAMPVAMVASILGISVYTHEQTIHPGLANKTISRIAAKVFVSFPESAHFFPKTKTIITGNPIRDSVFEVRTKLPIPSGMPCVYITGGSLGAHAINVHIEHIVRDLISTFIVIHQTGNIREYNDYGRLKRIRDTMPINLQERYIIKTHIGDDEIGAIFQRADVVVTRSGANTFFELIALGKPAVLIPLPLAAYDEQRKHARILSDIGAALIFEQDQPSEKLAKSISNVLSNTKSYERAYRKVKETYNTNATERILEEIFEKSDI